MSRFDKRKESRSRTLVQVSVLVVILFMTSVFAFSHKIDKTLIKRDLKIITTDDFDVYYTKQTPLKSPVEPSKPKLIIAAEDGDEGIDENYIPIFENPDDILTTELAPFIEYTGNQEDIFTYVSVQEKPEMTSRARTKLSNYIYSNYPTLAKRSGVSGIVVLNFVCSRDGLPTSIRIVKETPKDMGFGKVALEAIRQVSFKPGLQRDKPVAVRMKLPIRFLTK